MSDGNGTTTITEYAVRTEKWNGDVRYRGGYTTRAGAVEEAEASSPGAEIVKRHVTITEWETA